MLETERKLWEFQEEDVQFAINRKRCILGHEMRLGKTSIALNAVDRIWDELHDIRILVVSPKSALHVWNVEAKAWGLPEFQVVHGGTPTAREKLWKIDNCITVYNTAVRDMRRGVMPRVWDIVIFDEAQRLRNRKSQAFANLAKSLKTKYLFFLTGTPMRRGPQDMWTMLHLISKISYPGFWKFAHTYCHVIDGEFGQEIIGVRNAENWARVRNRYMRRRTMAEVRPQLPQHEPIRQQLPIEMSKEQFKIYSDLAEQMVHDLLEGEEDEDEDDDDGLILTPNLLSMIIKLRQILVTPKLLHESLGLGAGMETILEHLEQRDDNHIVIFTPFAKALPFFTRALDDKGYKWCTLQGGTPPKQVGETIEYFKDERCTMLCTIKFAEGFDLSTSDTSYFLGYEWSPDENLQAEARLESLVNPHPRMTYYIKHLHSIDEHVLDVLTRKDQNVKRSLKTPRSILGMLTKK
jgi:SNF2 family DNA or RNA helicase